MAHPSSPAPHQVFLSVVVVFRNRAEQLRETLTRIRDHVCDLATDYEVIVVDNASTDASVETLRALTRAEGLPNVQVFALTKEVDADSAFWAGIENALGDYVAVLDPAGDDIAQVRAMLDRAMLGHDVVFTENEHKPPTSFAHRVGSAAFHSFYEWASGINLSREAPQFRMLSRRVVNFVLSHRSPAVAYRYLPATAGFSRSNLSYRFAPPVPRARGLRDSIDQSMRLLVSSTRAPMRLVTTLSLFGAVANVLYSVYVIGIAIWKADVAPGWVTLSLQQSGMFFLLSLVMWVLGEYILHMTGLINEGPSYHVAQEFNSAVMTRRNKLNVDELHPAKLRMGLAESRNAQSQS